MKNSDKSDGFLMLDKTFKLISANTSAKKMLDLKMDKKDFDVLEFLFAEDRDLRVGIMLSTIKDDLPYIFNKGNLQIEMDQDEEGNYFVFCRPQMKESARNEFISIASHELKTPLTALRLQVELAKKLMDQQGPEALGPEKLKTFIDRSYRDVQKLSRLVEDMFDVSNLAQNNMPMNFEYFNLEELLDDIIGRATQKMKELKMQLKVEINAPVMVRWDSFRVEQVLFNLLSNAILYGRNSQIEFKAATGGGYVYLSVKDMGQGISREKQKDIFNKYDRGSLNREISGLGLGLYLAKEIIELHGGKITVESALNKGSTFHIQVPVTPLLINRLT